jgi:hypothetical protein
MVLETVVGAILIAATASTDGGALALALQLSARWAQPPVPALPAGSWRMA